MSYVLTGSCSSGRRKRSASSQYTSQRWRRQSDTESLYEFIAAYTGGQVLNVPTSAISELASLITLSSQRSYTNMLHKTGPGQFSKTLNFSVDVTTDVVVISLTGQSIGVTIRTPGGEFI